MKLSALTAITLLLGARRGRRKLSTVRTTLTSLLTSFFNFQLGLTEHFLLLKVGYVGNGIWMGKSSLIIGGRKVYH